MMKTLLALLGALTGFFLVLNSLGGIVSGIWLAILGEWGAIGIGLVLVFVSTGVLGVALLPATGLAVAAYAARRSRAGLLFLGLLSNLYIAALITVWCVGVLVFFMH